MAVRLPRASVASVEHYVGQSMTRSHKMEVAQLPEAWRGHGWAQGWCSGAAARGDGTRVWSSVFEEIPRLGLLFKGLCIKIGVEIKSYLLAALKKVMSPAPHSLSKSSRSRRSSFLSC
jgi:hypothetical protein